MTKDLIVIFFGVILAIGFIIVVAYILQKQLVERRFSSDVKEPPQENPSPEYLELSERLRRNSGIDFPTFEIKASLSAPNSDDSIVMLNYKQAFQNILRCNSSGLIVWIAELPEKSGFPKYIKESADVYVHLAWDKQNLRAASASGFSVILDVETGKILSSVFTK